MSIMEEFLKDFNKEFSIDDVGIPPSIFPEEFAIWAAKWMAERCASLSEEFDRGDAPGRELAAEIRQLAKELEWASS